MGCSELKRRRTEGTVREERTPCPACRSEETKVLKTQSMPHLPWLDPGTGTFYAGRIRRRRECLSCRRVFFSLQGFKATRPG